LRRWGKAALRLLAWSAARTQLGQRDRAELKRIVPAHLEALRERGLDSLFYLSSYPNAVEQRVYDKVWRVQREALTALLGALEHEGVLGIVFKGAQAFESHYRSRAVGLMSDCDVLVPRADVVTTQAVLFRQGYRPAVFSGKEGRLIDRDIAEIGQIEHSHYELPPFSSSVRIVLEDDELEIARRRQRDPLWVIDNQAVVVVEFDVHHALATDIDGESLRSNAQRSPFGVGMSPSHSDHLWFLAARFYTEIALHGKTSLRDMAYILPIVESEEIDWDLVLRSARKYAIEPSLYYILSYADALASPGRVPSRMLAALRRNLGSRRDFGHLAHKLLGATSQLPSEVRSRRQ
jgi:hypothetical protein